MIDVEGFVYFCWKNQQHRHGPFLSQFCLRSAFPSYQKHYATFLLAPVGTRRPGDRWIVLDGRRNRARCSACVIQVLVLSRSMVELLTRLASCPRQVDSINYDGSA